MPTCVRPAYRSFIRRALAWFRPLGSKSRGDGYRYTLAFDFYHCGALDPLAGPNQDVASDHGLTHERIFLDARILPEHRPIDRRPLFDHRAFGENDPGTEPLLRRARM